MLLTFIFLQKINTVNAITELIFIQLLPTPPTGVWASATMVNWAGEVIQVDVNSGDIYQFSTCNIYGGVAASYDTELTLEMMWKLIGYNDDFTGCGVTRI